MNEPTKPRYRRPATFRQSDVARVLRAMKTANVNGSVTITPTGEIKITPGDRDAVAALVVANAPDIIL